MVPPTATAARARGVRFRPPTQQGGHVSRPRVTGVLDERTAEHTTVLVVAPSGYGKTSAVAEWASTKAESVAWLTLGTWDTDSAHIDVSVVRALRALAEESGRADLAGLLSIPAEDVNPAVTFDLIVEALVELPEPLLLIVDDAHRAGDALDAGLLGAFIRGECDRIQAVIVGTSPVELALSRIALTAPDCVIRPSVLAFTADEVRALHGSAELPVAAETALAETSGWPIALRFLQLSGVRPSASDQNDETVIRGYIRAHVLSSLPDDLTAFVLDSSVCTILTPGLAEAISGVDDGAALLERCAQTGLFLDRYETDTGPAYRWHSFAARQFRKILEETRPGRGSDVRRTASAHLRESDPLAAAQYLVEAGDIAEAITLIATRWVGLIVGTKAHALDRWCAALPGVHVDDPRVLLIRACVQDVIGHRDVAAMYATRADELGGTDPCYASIRARADLFLLDERAEVAAASRQVRSDLAKDATLLPADRAALLYLLGWAELRHRSSPQLTVQLLSSAATEAAASGQEALERRALGHLACSYAWTGQLRLAQEVLSRGIDLSDDGNWSTYAGGSTATASGVVAFWQDDLDTAIADLRRAIRGGSSVISFGGVARMTLAFAAAATRDPHACQFAAREVQSLPSHDQQGVSWAAFRHVSFAALYEATGRREQALKILAMHEDINDMPMVMVILAGLAERLGRPTTALRMLRRLARYDDILYVRVSRLLIEGVLHWREDRMRQAHDAIEEALALAVPENLRRPFAGGGLDVRQVLTEQLAWGTDHEEFILSCLTPRAEGGQLTALSDREREVFAQLRTTRTMQEIADGLGVSINTIKTHQRAIYRKLGVASRREAVRLFA